jgi:small nuclear ribonucleoprotein G
MPQAQPELKKVRNNHSAIFNKDHSCLEQYMEKRLFIQLNGNRKVLGILRGYDVRDRAFFPSGTTHKVADGFDRFF